MWTKLKALFSANDQKKSFLPPSTGGPFQVAADATRCVQCGICGYNCPVGIEVREYARRGRNVTDPRCISCGACIEKCPRGTLRWGRAILIGDDLRLQTDPDALPVWKPAEIRLASPYSE